MGNLSSSLKHTVKCNTTESDLLQTFMVQVFPGAQHLFIVRCPFSLASICPGAHLSGDHLSWYPFVLVSITPGPICPGTHLSWGPFVVEPIGTGAHLSWCPFVRCSFFVLQSKRCAGLSKSGACSGVCSRLIRCRPTTGKMVTEK